MTTPAPMYKLVNRDLLRRLMDRTGSGSPVSIRDLAAAVGVPHGTIGNLLSGYQESVPADIAHRIAAQIGVAVLILWAPPAAPDEIAPLPVQMPVSA
ncbi:helix-turn-helix domain-containing protein [Streptomyces acidiscabies]|uniref:helix-turn-helix domain-containing protein n=1 Tax=Streptomyces acidiscabies TaxID=42234 RepID=UPI00076ECE67|nr:helix-turn-helix transcriptional regulator [Streptomyces acidiscabies]GAQ52125.1 hypothetical protein a10_01906 [Streptomyces acidiscabies]